jgi:hypothetical protein
MPNNENNIAQQKAEFLKALEENCCLILRAAEKTGIPRRNHYLWIKEDPEYKKAYDAMGDVALDFSEDALFKSISNGSDSANIFFLKCKGKARGYIETHRHEIAADVNVKAIPQDVIDDSLEKLLGKE